MTQPTPRLSRKSRSVPDEIRAFFGPTTSGETRALFEARFAQGRKTYGVDLHTHNGRDAIRDAVEELADAVIYLTQSLMEAEDNNDTARVSIRFRARAYSLLALEIIRKEIGL